MPLTLHSSPAQGFHRTQNDRPMFAQETLGACGKREGGQHRALRGAEIAQQGGRDGGGIEGHGGALCFDTAQHTRQIASQNGKGNPTDADRAVRRRKKHLKPLPGGAADQPGRGAVPCRKPAERHIEAGTEQVQRRAGRVIGRFRLQAALLRSSK